MDYDLLEKRGGYNPRPLAWPPALRASNVASGTTCVSRDYAPRAGLDNRAVVVRMRAVMAKEIYALGEVPPLGEVPRRMHAQVIRASTLRRAERRPSSRRNAGTGSRAARRPGLRDGSRRQLQQRLGRARHPGQRHRARARRPARPRTSTSAAPTRAASSGRSARTSRTSRSATRSWSIAASGITATARRCGGQRPDVRAVASGSGATRPTGAASPSSPRCRTTSVCRSPSTLTWEEAAAYMLVGATAYRMLHGWAPQHGAARRRRC